MGHLHCKFQSINIIMKFIAALLALFAVASAQDLCERCGEGVMALGQYLQTDEEIAAVEQGLVDLVCTTLPERTSMDVLQQSSPGGLRFPMLFSATKEPLLLSALELDIAPKESHMDNRM